MIADPIRSSARTGYHPSLSHGSLNNDPIYLFKIIRPRTSVTKDLDSKRHNDETLGKSFWRVLQTHDLSDIFARHFVGNKGAEALAKSPSKP